MEEARTTVSIENIRRDLAGAVTRIMDRHEVGGIIRDKPEAVYIKVNGIDFKPYTYTSIEVTGAVIDYCREAGAREVYVMENSTQSNFTRLVLHVAGFEGMTDRHPAELLYLDEGRQARIGLPRMGYDVRVSKHVKRIIDDRDSVCYFNLPRLKTHSMTVLTCGIKNQYGLIAQEDRSPDHNWRLHRKIADIYSVIQPDFTVVDGTVATAYGHYPPRALHKKALVPFNILVGGPDTLAVDTVCARILGYDVDEVGHLREARDMGLGCADLDRIEVAGETLDRFTERYPYELYDAFPPDVEVIKGRERNCLEGCRANTLALLQVLYLDFDGKGGFTIVMGKGHDREVIDSIEGRVFIAGPCAYDEVGRKLTRRLGKKNVFFSRECNDLASITGGLTRLMKVSPLSMVPLSPLKSIELLTRAKLHRTTARIPPLFPV